MTEDDLIASGVTTCRHRGKLFERSKCWEHGPAWKAANDLFNAHSAACRWCGPMVDRDSFETSELCATGQMMFREVCPGNATRNPDDLPEEDEQYGDAPGDHAWGRR